MLRRVWNLAVKESIQLRRDRMMTLLIVLLPLAQLFLLAQATGQSIGELPLGVVDRDRSADSRRLVQALANVPELKWRYDLTREEELTGLLDRGQAAVGVIIPPGFGDALGKSPTALDGDLPVVQVIVDGSNSIVGNTAQGAAESTIGEYVRRLAAARGLNAAAPVTLHSTVRYNPDLNARLAAIPAQMGFIIYQITLAVAALAFARERELGTLEQLLVTPLRRLELIMGKATVAWLVGVVDFLLMYVIITRGFQIPMRGSFALLLAFTLLFIVAEIGIGIIVSSFSRTQQQAVLYVFMLAMLDVALSGYLVPIKNTPQVFQTLAQVSPLQHYLVVIRSIMLKGAGLTILWPHAVAMVALGITAAAVATATATRSLE